MSERAGTVRSLPTPEQTEDDRMRDRRMRSRVVNALGRSFNRTLQMAPERIEEDQLIAWGRSLSDTELRSMGNIGRAAIEWLRRQP